MVNLQRRDQDGKEPGQGQDREWRFILGKVGSQHSLGDRFEEGVNRLLIGRTQSR